MPKVPAILRTLLAALVTFAVSACDQDQEQPTQQRSPEVAKAEKQAPQNADVIFIGDSILSRWDSLGRVFPGVTNAGIGGQRSCELWNRFDRDVISRHPKILVIHVGVNDVSLDYDPSPLCVFLMASAALSDGATVVVSSLLPIENWTGSRAVNSNQEGIDKLAAYNRELREGASAYGYLFVDHDKRFKLNGRRRNELFNDAAHPNGRGYMIFANTLRDTDLFGPPRPDRTKP